MTAITVDVAVPMVTRDGVTLLADVYRPADGEPVPALLHRTPYDRTDPTLVAAIVADPVRLARQGYAVVVQDVRGRFASGGVMVFFHQEQADGFDAVEWAAAQPWCDGRVGIYGSSYHAMTAFQAVAARPPHLRAAVAMIGATDLAATTHPGGLFELGFLTCYGLGHAVEEARRAGRPDLLAGIAAAFADPHATVATLPVHAVPVLRDLDFWADWLDGSAAAGTADSGGAGAPTLMARPDLVDVPLLQVVAFRDFMAPTMVELAGRLRGPHRLVAGPWTHGGTYTGHVGSRTFPGATGGVGTWGPLIAGWFDRHLRGRSELVAGPATRRLLGEPGGDPVVYYATGENSWQDAPSWPPPGGPVTLHLAPDATLGPAAAADGTRCYRSDPLDPFPTCGGASSGAALGPDGVQDRRALDARADVLRYTSTPLAEPLRIAGPVTLVVHLASDAEDVDVCATLVDIEPDGFAAGISEGAHRVSHGGARLVPGEVTVIRVRLHDTAHTFRAGHRVRLELAGANFPRLSRNLHTRTRPEHGTAADAVVAHQRVHHGPAHPSRLELHGPA